MTQITVTLVRADTNQEFDVELPDDAKIAELLPALVKELGLPVIGSDGNSIAYEIANKRTGRECKENDTLGTASTKTGDVFLLTSTFVAGGGGAFRNVNEGRVREATQRKLDIEGIQRGYLHCSPEQLVEVVTTTNDPLVREALRDAILYRTTDPAVLARAGVVRPDFIDA
jgi:hypothetical protein